MEYTKDVVLDVKYKSELGKEKINMLFDSLKEKIQKNKLLLITLVFLSFLMTIDIVLINSFFEILSNLA